jgi:ATP-dependent DNA ligase
VFDGELVVLDDAGRPLFDALLFGRRRATKP